MGCCNSADHDAAGDDSTHEFNDLQKDDKGAGMGAQRPKGKGGAAAAAGSSKYAASGSNGGADTPIDMDAIHGAEAPPAAAAGSSGGGAAAAAAAGDDDGTSSTSSASSEAPSPPPPAARPAAMAARGGPDSLALTAEEEAAHRARVQEVHKELGAPKALEVVFDDMPDDDMDLVDMMDRAARGDGAIQDNAAIEEFEAGLLVASPTTDAGLENAKKNGASKEPPLEQWFADRGVAPPKSVVWFQSNTDVTIEIAPANDDVGYALEDGGETLLYNCQDPSETDLLAMSSKAGGGEGNGDAAATRTDYADDDIVLYMTTITGDRQVRDYCRLMENQLFLHELKFVAVDVAENGFIRKRLVAMSGGVDNGLPLLFVGDRFVCDYKAMQDLIDNEKFLDAIGPAAVAKAKKDSDQEGPELNAAGAAADSAALNPTQYRVDLHLLHPLRGAKFTVERSTRPGAAADERMLVLRASKEQKGKYWSQLIHGSLAEVASIEWLRKDLSREADSDEEDDD